MSEEKMKQHYKSLANKKKNLKQAELSSLLASIDKCTDFGDDAELFITGTKVCPSLYYQYSLALKKIGIDVISFRESTRYTFMLLLSLQQTWKKGLGDILTRTKFVNCQKFDTKVTFYDDPTDFAISMLKESKDYKSIAIYLKQHNQDIVWCSFYKNEGKLLICTYVKPKQTYQYLHLFGYFPERINIQNKAFVPPQVSAIEFEQPEEGDVYNPFNVFNENLEDLYIY